MKLVFGQVGKTNKLSILFSYNTHALSDWSIDDTKSGNAPLFVFFFFLCYPVDGNLAHWLSDFLVTVSNTRFPVTYDQLSSFTRCGQYSGYPAASQWGRVTCSPGPVRGRYVYVSIDNASHYLVMCEVKVFGGMYRKISNISRTLVGYKFVDHSDVVGASPVGAAPTTSSFST